MFGRGAGAGAAGVGAGTATATPPLTGVCSAEDDFSWDETTLSNKRTFATNSSAMKCTELFIRHTPNLFQDNHKTMYRTCAGGNDKLNHFEVCLHNVSFLLFI